MDSLFSFKAFLSHRYESPEINLYFFDLFGEMKDVEVQFEVDEAISIDGKKPRTNVTRLEQMVKAADAFIGIYPFPGTLVDARSIQKLKEESRYFRLEMDLAIRSGKPALIFFDNRYVDLLKPPSSILSVEYDFLEISGEGAVPRRKSHQNLFRKFCENVRARKAMEDSLGIGEKTTVGLILPGSSYTKEIIEMIRSILIDYMYMRIEIFEWPLKLQRDTFRLFDELDMVIIDIGEETVSSGVVAYLHGRFMPMVRLINSSAESDSEKLKLLIDFLYGGVEAGYGSDTLRWGDTGVLETGLKERLERIKAPKKRIKKNEDAVKYFISAALRKEPVFLSYSSKNIDFANKFSKALKRHFKEVFDYMDGQSIRPGQPWLQEIFTQLESSQIGISLLSPGYVDSENCMHELREMIARRDSKEMYWLPIRLTDELKSPPGTKDIEHLFASNYDNNVESICKELIRLFELELSKRNVNSKKE